MNKPPDPGGPVPPAVCYVTIESSETNSLNNMETEVVTTHSPDVQSLANGRKRKNPKDIDNHVQGEKVNKANFVPIGRTQYNATDRSPFVIHVIREQTVPNDGSSLHPITFGRYLKKHNIRGIVDGSVKRIGRNRICLSFSNHKDANTFINSPSLILENLKAFIPTFSITRMGLVRGIPTEWTDDEIIENINVPLGCGKILKVRRLNYKTTVDGSPIWKPSQTVVVTFDGRALPQHIYMCYNAIAVELYNFPTIICFNCCNFGHTKNQCRSKARCYKCGQEHSGDTCSINDDCVICCHCSGSHFATNKSCPEYVRQTKIKLSMSENCISYAEAKKLHAPVGKSYAEVLSTKPSPIQKPILSKPPNPLMSLGPSRGKIIPPKPRPPPRLMKGYDKSTHQALVKEYNIPSGPNGCGYDKSSHDDQDGVSQQGLKEIIFSLIDTLIQNNILIPSTVAPLLETLQKSPPTLRPKTFKLNGQ